MKAEGTAMVSGASRGIGRCLALELAARGFEVVAGARDPATAAGLAEEARRAGGRLRVERLDVTRPETLAPPDGLRVLVNNAGVEPEYLPVEHTPLDIWRSVFETNLFGLVELTRRSIPKLRAAGGGVVCNLTTSSLLAPVPLYAAYRASKAAVSALGETLTAELDAFGIRVLEILPGPIGTDMFARSAHRPEGARYPEYRNVAERVHAGRMGTERSVTPPDRAARAIVDAILDDDAPLRRGCDPLSDGLLASWREQGDEAFRRGMLPAFVAPGTDA